MGRVAEMTIDERLVAVVRNLHPYPNRIWRKAFACVRGAGSSLFDRVRTGCRFCHSLRGACTLAPMVASGRGSALSRHCCFHRASLRILAGRHRLAIGGRNSKLLNGAPGSRQPHSRGNKFDHAPCLHSHGNGDQPAFRTGQLSTPGNRTHGAARCTISMSSRAEHCR